MDLRNSTIRLISDFPKKPLGTTPIHTAQKDGWKLTQRTWTEICINLEVELIYVSKVSGISSDGSAFADPVTLGIGRNLALMEINMVVPQLLRRFKFKLVDPQMVIQHHSTFFVVQSGLKVYLSSKQA